MDTWLPICSFASVVPVGGASPAMILRLAQEIASNLDRFVRTAVPVTLHVYDLAHSRTVSRLNSRALGAFHVAVEVYGYEWSFGWNDDGETGVFACAPKECEMHTYRESLSMGTTMLSRDQVNELLDEMEPRWLGEDYDMVARNCCTFSNEFAQALGVGAIPKRLFRLANAGAAVESGYNSLADGMRAVKVTLGKLTGPGSK